MEYARENVRSDFSYAGAESKPPYQSEFESSYWKSPFSLSSSTRPVLFVASLPFVYLTGVVSAPPVPELVGDDFRLHGHLSGHLFLSLFFSCRKKRARACAKARQLFVSALQIVWHEPADGSYLGSWKHLHVRVGCSNIRGVAFQFTLFSVTATTARRRRDLTSRLYFYHLSRFKLLRVALHVFFIYALCYSDVTRILWTAAHKIISINGGIMLWWFQHDCYRRNNHLS